jgi:hypothetical protein
MKANAGLLYEAHLLAPPSGPNTVNVTIFIFDLMTEGCRAFEALCVFNRNRILEEVIYTGCPRRKGQYSGRL